MSKALLLFGSIIRSACKDVPDAAPAAKAEAPEAVPEKAAAVAAPAAPVADTTPDWGDDVEVKQTSVREALRDATGEATRRYEDLLLMGADVRE